MKGPYLHFFQVPDTLPGITPITYQGTEGALKVYGCVGGICSAVACGQPEAQIYSARMRSGHLKCQKKVSLVWSEDTARHVSVKKHQLAIVLAESL